MHHATLNYLQTSKIRRDVAERIFETAGKRKQPDGKNKPDVFLGRSNHHVSRIGLHDDELAAGRPDIKRMAACDDYRNMFGIHQFVDEFLFAKQE
jgi:rRNA pseudouridine-1189 N-methylase Emg1 (Nep1/Mra1 family)